MPGDEPQPPFEVRPPAEPGPIVVEVPHAGLEIDPRFAPTLGVPDDVLAAGVLFADSDVGAAALWDGLDAAGLTLVLARASRFVIDLNTEPRLPTPYEDKLPDALREVRRRSQGGLRWYQRPPPRSELERRLRDVFEPYHAAVAAALDRVRARNGAALLVSAHTYPDASFPRAADVVLGTRGGTLASQALRDVLATLLRERGLTVEHDAPFAGGYSVLRHASGNVQAVQVELARRLVCAPGEPAQPALDPDAVSRLRASLHAVFTDQRLLAVTVPGHAGG